MSSRLSRHPLLAAGVAAYLLLSGVELVRLLAVAPVSPADAGFYAWERGSTGQGDRMGFRWTGAAAAMTRAPRGDVMRFALMPGAPETRSERVRLLLDGELLDEITLRDDGWRPVEYYLPPVLGAERWEALRARAGGAAGRSDGWRELQPWSAGADNLLTLQILSPATFRPAELEGSNDPRELGVAVAPLRWRDGVPAGGIGFHAEETTPDGATFRWTRRRASLPARAAGRELSFTLRADHPDIESSPVVVTVYWDAIEIQRLELSDRAPREVTLATASLPGVEGVVTIAVDRTWSPAAAGVSPDTRELGVAVTPLLWR